VARMTARFIRSHIDDALLIAALVYIILKLT
jgi:hypothetical protein